MSEKYEPVRANVLYVRPKEGEELRVTKGPVIVDLEKKIEELEGKVSSLEGDISSLQLQIHDLAVKS